MPGYLRSEVKPGIVHLGVGGFSRSHFNIYTDTVLEKDPRWGIVGAGLTAADERMHDALVGQDWMYTVMTKGTDGKVGTRVCASMIDYIWAGQGVSNQQRLIEQLVAPETKIVSLTVTEKGYTADLTSDELDFSLPENNWMLNHTAGKIKALEAVCQGISPFKSPLSFLTAACELRRQRGLPGLTIMSCDNLQGNGQLLEKLMHEYVDLFYTDSGFYLQDWIRENCTFPNSVLDRITARTSLDEINELKEVYGICDNWPVVAEKRSRWVIEDKFATERPEWELAGAIITKDTNPYMQCKLRLHNGCRQGYAYLSYVSGHRNIADATKDPVFTEYIKRFLNEVDQTIPEVPELDLENYKVELVERFGNEGLDDKLIRLCEDTSFKMEESILPTILHKFRFGAPAHSLEYTALGIAGWIRFLQGTDEKGHEIQINDPMAEDFIELAHTAYGNGNVKPFMAAAFGSRVASSQQFCHLIGNYLMQLKNKGVHETLKEQFNKPQIKDYRRDLTGQSMFT